ncbi:MAG TPA: tetratricopeptide repeat protein [Pyrinomonadaceae bacterium]|jgi:tetratricopeptide (TPR) repeat protein
MKLFRLLSLLLLLIIVCSQPGLAQEGAAWQVTRFDITANVRAGERVLEARALLNVRNVGRGAGSTITVRLNPKAEIKSVSVNDAAATFSVQPESRGNLQRVLIRIPAQIAPDSTAKVLVEYRLPLAENTGLASISPVETQFLPLSFWYPAPNTIYSLRGADAAPFRLEVNGAQALSSGTASTPRGASVVYEQSLNGQPFFLSGDWDATSGTGEARNVNALLPKGASIDEKKQAEALVNLAAAARSFYASILGPAPNAPLNLVAVARGAGLNDAGTVLLSPAAFRRGKIDSASALLVAEAVARLWLGGETSLRGEGSGVIREGLARHLANLFLEKQFGREAAEAERIRQRASYAAVARRDAPLAQTTPLDDTYFNSVSNKGALIWRLVERAMGREAFLEVVRASLQGAKTSAGGLGLAALRSQFSARGGEGVRAILDQGLDKPTDMDLLIGVPQQKGGNWVAALRNLGSFDAAVTVAAYTDRGERLTVETTIPARSFGEAVFKTASRLVRAEIDPDKLYPQLDYSNDVAPRARLGEDALAEATRLFAAQQYAQAESLLREQLALTPRMQEARVLLARMLLAGGKLDEAEKEFRAALDERLPAPSTLAWANIGLGELALRKGQAAEAVRRFNDAVRADAEYASTLAARAGRINAESKAGIASPVDESARNFISQLDQAIKGGNKAGLEALVVPGELARFIQGIVGSQPELWQTRVLRTEQLDANRIAADVSINARQFGRDQTGTALLVLARVGGSWRLAAIEFFEVR